MWPSYVLWLITWTITVQLSVTVADSFVQPSFKMPQFNQISGKADHLNVPATVELAIVCDKEFGDLFDQNHEKILNYWKVFMWDVNNRFKTINGTNITIQISSLSVMKLLQHQPFIEKARDPRTKAVDLSKVLRHFGKWPEQKPHRNFDVTMVVTGASYKNFAAGKAYVRGACRSKKKQNFAVVVISDKGDFRVGTATHELGHALGALHDTDWHSECQERGYLMDDFDRRIGPEQFHFSPCSSRMIQNFLASEQAACLKVKNFPGIAVYEPADVPIFIPPTFEDQCKRSMGSSKAFVFNAQEYDSICQKAICARRQEDGTLEYKSFTPVDITACSTYGFCNRGKCERGEERVLKLVLIGTLFAGIILCGWLISCILRKKREARQLGAIRGYQSDLDSNWTNEIFRANIKNE